MPPSSPSPGATWPVRIAAIRPAAEDIVTLDLVAVDGGELPPFTAGAHIDLHLPGGMVRHYSLVNDPAERHRYRIAVKKEAGGRGGSRHVHEKLAEGDRLTVGGPRNHFAVPAGTNPLLLLAGGVGIAPIRSMIHAAERQGRPWRLHYAARSRGHAAFREELAARGPERVRFWFDADGEPLDLARALADDGATLLCCGPAGLMEAVRAATAGWPEERVRFEWFTPPATAAVEDGAFEVELRRSGRTVLVPAGRSILDALLDAGADVPFSCNEGVCGCCETAVLDGAIDHRDVLLSAAERSAGRTMMICVSRALGHRLVLDL